MSYSSTSGNAGKVQVISDAEKLINALRAKLAGTPGPVSVPRTDAFRANGTHEVLGTIAKALGRDCPPESVRETIAAALAKYPADVAANAWAQLEPPEREPRRPPSLADAKKFMTGMKWIWQDWILAGQLTLVTAESGAGKSTVMAELARRVYKGEPWPDGTPQTIEPRRPVLWLNSDKRTDQLADLWEFHGLPADTACFLAHDPEKPLNPHFLDDPETIVLLNEYVDAVNPWALVIDTISRATSQDLCTPGGVTAITGPLLELSNRTGIAIFLLGHTNKDGNAFGRHLKTTCQVCWKIEGNSSTNARTLKNDDRAVAKPPEPIGATIQIDGSWKWGDAVNLDEGGRTIGCARLITDVIKRSGDMGFKDLLSACEIGGGYAKSTVSKALQSLVDLGTLVQFEDTSKNGKKFKKWSLGAPSDDLAQD